MNQLIPRLYNQPIPDSSTPSVSARPIPRIAAAAARERLAGFPILTITGPRQCGKTTLSRLLAPHLPYLSLEDPDTRAFLRQAADGAILDEIQRAPELFSYLFRQTNGLPQATHTLLGKSDFSTCLGKEKSTQLSSPRKLLNICHRTDGS